MRQTSERNWVVIERLMGVEAVRGRFATLEEASAAARRLRESPAVRTARATVEVAYYK